MTLEVPVLTNAGSNRTYTGQRTKTIAGTHAASCQLSQAAGCQQLTHSGSTSHSYAAVAAIIVSA